MDNNTPALSPIRYQYLRRFLISTLRQQTPNGESDATDASELRNAESCLRSRALGNEIDFLALFDSLTVRHEADAKLDVHGRVCASENPHDEVVVDRWVAMFHNMLTDHIPSDKRPELLLSHDVDRIHFQDVFFIGKTMLASLRQPRRFSGLFRVLRSRSAILRNFESICDLEAKYGASSVFFFLCEPYRLRRYNSRYSFDYRLLPNVFRIIRDAECEIGLHGSYYSFDGARYADQRERLEDLAETRVRANRNHYLRFDPFRTPDGLAQSGIRLDSSMGFSDINGFRNGSSFPYKWYDIGNNAELPLLEVPMVYMDTVGYNRGDDFETAVEEISRILERVKNIGGTVSLLFHYDIISEDSVWNRIYEYTLKTASEEGFRFVTPTELICRYDLEDQDSRH